MQLNLFESHFKIIAGTGHRPNKLTFGKWKAYDPLMLHRLTDLAIWYFEKESPDKVITGMALGWDSAIALAAIKLNIPLIAAVPFVDQDKLWKPQDKVLYSRILSNCEEVVIVCDGDYSAHKMMLRNRYMVDKCTNLVALYDGISSGGTANCIKYAVSKNVPIDNLWSVIKSVKFGY